MFHATFIEENNRFQAKLVHEQVDEITAEGTRQKGIVEVAGTEQVTAVNNAGAVQVHSVENAGAEQVDAVTAEGNTQKSAITTYCEEKQTVIDQKVTVATRAKDDAVMAKEQAETAQQNAETAAQIATQRAAEAAQHDILTQTGLTVEQQTAARTNINAAPVAGSYELIETITLTENVASIVRTQKPDGTPYKFKAIGVVVSAEIGSVNSGINVQAYYNETKLRTGFIGDAITNSIKKYGYAQIYPDWGAWTAIGSTAVNGFTWIATRMTGYSPAQAFSVKESENPYCTQMVMQVSEPTATIPAGTVISIYGVRA